MKVNPCSYTPCRIKEKIKQRYNTTSCHDHCPFHKSYQKQVKLPKKEYIGISDDAYYSRDLHNMTKNRYKLYRKGTI